MKLNILQTYPTIKDTKIAKPKTEIKKVLLTKPNYSTFGKRSFKLFPYSLAILNACIKDYFKTDLFDPDFDNLNDKQIIDYLKQSNPEAIGMSTNSTEYLKNNKHMAYLIKKALPDSILIVGGAFPTANLNGIMDDKNIDYLLIGEAEINFPNLLKELNKDEPDLSSIKGIAYYNSEGIAIINQSEFIQDLNSIPFADYGNLDFMKYANKKSKYAQGICAKKYPYAIMTTSKGCIYRCSFCAVHTISGRKMRMRSPENVLAEIDQLYKKGVREVIFLDDHFLFDRQRVIDIMEGLIKRDYDLLWKCANLTGWLLDEELISLMKKSKCYQVTISIESGNQEVLKKIVRKPINLEKIKVIMNLLKEYEIETIVNFVIGFPKETWDQIRETCQFAGDLKADLINFHIATPLPDTELMKTAIDEGLLPSDANENTRGIGYTDSVISTKEFTAIELKILRAYEWDRINFSTGERKKVVARIQGISLEELEQWRKKTRANLGVNVV